jgi:hypothetical protein
MEQVLKLAENYMIQRVVSDHSPLTHANKAALSLSIFGSILGVVALGFILFGTLLWLHQNMPPYEAYIIFGVLLLVISIISFLIIGFIQWQKRKKTLAFKNQIRDEALLTLKLAEAEIKDLQILENHPKTCVALASLAGFIIAEKVI